MVTLKQSPLIVENYFLRETYGNASGYSTTNKTFSGGKLDRHGTIARQAADASRLDNLPYYLLESNLKPTRPTAGRPRETEEARGHGSRRSCSNLRKWRLQSR
jgi:hypothetical protein